ncbi:WD40/YVTN/BNR-like repeat-containing protein [Tunicatimonas pelagia]|uniref:WD40/YVTN/BNR-like repeat-containing protein n=1 Tax=Tunicatimonas pelagia TaxID=931531 RepID=UPI002665E0A1|nr:YCF48-related protein [Tunicatimonas pelagia]WKN42171.1 YCF48-related protein [Tunicatimonas pelagia]
MSIKTWVVIFGGLILLGCNSNERRIFSPTWETLNSGTTVSLRGLSAVSDEVAWASGQFGTILRTVDGGQTWEKKQIPGTDSVDFRDIEAFSDQLAYVLSAGSPAYIFKTENGGSNWVKQLEDTLPNIFLDGMAFWNEQRGMVIGDPINEKFTLLSTTSGGQNWSPIVPTERSMRPSTGEAGFAASGTNITVQGSGCVWFGTGGTNARIFRSLDGGETWEVNRSPLAQGTSSKGIFSLAFVDTLRGVAVGGDYRNPNVNTENSAYTANGGRTWYSAITPPQGYRSGVAYLPNAGTYVTVGTTGSDYSTDFGATWTFMDTVGYHSVQTASSSSVAWACGADGKIARLTW